MSGKAGKIGSIRRDLPRSGSLPGGASVSVREEEHVAVESVRTGLVTSLEADCLKYQTENKHLRAANASLQAGLGSRDGPRADKAEAALRDAKHRLEETKQQLRNEVQMRMGLEEKLEEMERKIGTEKDALKQVTAQLHSTRRQMRETELAAVPAVAHAEAARGRAEAEAEHERAEREELGRRLRETELLLGAQQDEAARATAAAARAASEAEAAVREGLATAGARIAAATAEAQQWRVRCEEAEVETSRLSASKKSLEAKLSEAKAAVLSAAPRRNRPADEDKPHPTENAAGKEAVKELAKIRGELIKVNEALKSERAKLAAQRAANRALEETAAQQATRYAKAAQRAEQAEKRAAGVAAGTAGLVREKEELSAANGELQAALADARGKLASLVAERRQASIGDTSQHGVMSNSNFVKMRVHRPPLARPGPKALPGIAH